jgi:small subunit ribosomal protein S6
MGIRELAYPIRKLHRGYYVLAEYDSDADVVREFERTLKIADEVLRFVSVATVTTTPKTKPGRLVRRSRAPRLWPPPLSERTSNAHAS